MSLTRKLSGTILEPCNQTEFIPVPNFLTPFVPRETDNETRPFMPHRPTKNKIRGHIRTQEEMKRKFAVERVEHERRMREERHKVWRHRTSIRLLCTSVDSLFLFFAQRVANLAGSRRTHNDALRSNGEY